MAMPPKITFWERGMYITSDEFIKPMDWKYSMEKWMYGVSSFLGIFAFLYTVQRLLRTKRKDLILATRLFSYKMSLTVADVLILFLYAPTQYLWITTFWWYGGHQFCRWFKFLSTFGFHLTANMQVLVAFDRLYITATMSTVRLSAQRNQPYRTYRFLIAAWVAAFCCSAPQLWIFGTAVTPTGKEQCVSIWLQTRMDHTEQRMYLGDYDRFKTLESLHSDEVFHPNGSYKVFYKEPHFTWDSIKDEAMNIMYLEQVYNVIHLSTICVLPYILELFCYTFILYILKGAQYGYFLSVKDVCKIKLCCFADLQPKKREKKIIRRPFVKPTVKNSLDSMEESMIPKNYVLPQRCSTPLPERHDIKRKDLEAVKDVKVGRDENGPLYIKRLEYEEIKKAKLLEIEKAKLCAKESIDKNAPVEKYEPAPFRYTYKGNQRGVDLRGDLVVLPPHGAKDRRKTTTFLGRKITYEPADTVPPRRFMKLDVHVPRIRIRKIGEEDPLEGMIQAPWIATVGYARRRARQKAFWMLSMNLLLWGPYCAMGIANAVTVFHGFANFQFVAALVVFNAISNIIL